MGFEKDEVMNTGVTANYWQIDNLCINAKGIAKVYLSLYLDKAAADSGKTPFNSEYFELTGFTAEALAKKDPYTLAYEKLQAKPAFETAKAK